MGSADIYAAVDRVPEVADSLVIGAELDGGGYWMPLFVTLAADAELDDELCDRIRSTIREVCSARHVPDEILEAPAIPRTLTGKRLEVPLKRLLQGFDAARVVNAGVVDNPRALDWFRELGERRRTEAGGHLPEPARARVTEGAMTAAASGHSIDSRWSNGRNRI